MNIKKQNCSVCHKKILYDCCPTHLSLKIKKSNIRGSGKGVFINALEKIPLKPVYQYQDFICEYKGELLDKQLLKNLYGDNVAPYAMKIDSNSYIDCINKRSIASMINHHITKENVIFYKAKDKRVWIVAKRNLYHNEELYVNYGNEYW